MTDKPKILEFAWTSKDPKRTDRKDAAPAEVRTATTTSSIQEGLEQRCAYWEATYQKEYRLHSDTLKALQDVCTAVNKASWIELLFDREALTWNLGGGKRTHDRI